VHGSFRYHHRCSKRLAAIFSASPEQIAARAGAAMVHLHVRDPKIGAADIVKFKGQRIATTAEARALLGLIPRN